MTGTGHRRKLLEAAIDQPQEPRMTVVPTALHRAVQAIIWVYKSGLTAPETFAYPAADEHPRTAPAESRNEDAPLAGRGSAG
jgi:hypothetical protein